MGDSHTARMRSVEKLDGGSGTLRTRDAGIVSHHACLRAALRIAFLIAAVLCGACIAPFARGEMAPGVSVGMTSLRQGWHGSSDSELSLGTVTVMSANRATHAGRSGAARVATALLALGLKSALAQAEHEVGRVEGDATLGALGEGESKADQDLYGRLLVAARERGVEDRTMVPAVAIVEPAAANPRPVRPHTLLDLVLSPIAGLAFGVGLVLLRSSIRPVIHDPEDVRESLRLPTVAVVPRRQRLRGV